MTQTAPSKHCRLSPSSSKRWLACPFSAQTNLPDSSNAAAETGQDIHNTSGGILLGTASINDVPKAWRAGVQMYVDHINANEGSYVVEHFWESIIIDDFGGTADCTIINGNTCAVYDLKTGKWPVDAVDNTQLMSYCSIIAEHHNVDEFFGVIVQPKSKEKEKIKVATYSLEMIDEHRERVVEAAVSKDKGTGDHCRFCPLRLSNQCNEGARYAFQRGWK